MKQKTRADCVTLFQSPVRQDKIRDEVHNNQNGDTASVVPYFDSNYLFTLLYDNAIDVLHQKFGNVLNVFICLVICMISLLLTQICH